MSDDSDDDANLRYGTPLEAYEDDELPKKKTSFQDIREQYAVDSNGKRRFHGAFTGGFTAGYGNTVGAPEGFTPATFKSSRSERQSTSSSLRPEDFMDDEDRSEFGIAPKQIQPNTEFTGHKRKKQTQFHDGPIPGAPVLESLLQPAHETVAVKILRGMGWRPGKGVGEKVTVKERNKIKKVYTCFIPQEMRPKATSETENRSGSSSNSSDEDDVEKSTVLFEPDDFEPYIAKPKNDLFGLGYSGLSRHSVLGSLSGFDTGDGDWKGSHLVTMDKGRKVSIRGQAFGVGALEEDDEDIYSREDMTNYDFTLGPSVSGDKSSKKGKGKASSGSSRKVLEGFQPASKPTQHGKVFPPPALPRDYVPMPPKPSRFSATKIGCSEPAPIRDRGLGRHDLTAQSRGQILGEPSLAGPSTAEADTSQTSSEDRIAAVAGRTVSFVGDDEAENKADETSSKFKPFSANVDKQLRYEKFVALKDRGLTTEDLMMSKGADRRSDWERIRELKQFELAFKLYRPLTGIMKDRFVSATRTDDENSASNKKPDVDKSKYANDDKIEAARLGMFGKLTREVINWVPESLLCKRFNVAEPFNGGYLVQPKEKKKSGFSIFEYLETPAHDRGSYLKEQSNAEKKVEEKISPPSTKEPETKMDVQEIVARPKRLTTVELFLQEKEKEKEKLLIDNRQLAFQKEIIVESKEIGETIDNFNKIDLYKAVFLSDSESDDEKEEKNKGVEPLSKVEEKSVEKRQRKTRFDSPPKNIERNESPPKGIFANLNFDRLNSWQNSSTRTDEDSLITKSISKSVTNAAEIKEKTVSNATETKDKNVSNDTETKDKNVSNAKETKDKNASNATETKDKNDDNFYGPKLPEKHKFVPSSKRIDKIDKPVPIQVDSSSGSDSEDGWIDVKEAASRNVKSKKKKEKKDKKKSKHKHKHKSKHKKRKT